MRLADDAVGGKYLECRGDVGHDVEPVDRLDWTLKRLDVEAVDGRRRKIPPVYFAS